jgi:RNA polymerase sigma-70 factor (ECF subfamily)
MLEDLILLHRSRQGDRQAFDRLYCKHLDALLTVARSLLGNANDAEDVVQEVLALLLESLATFRLRSSLRGFLVVCVANRCRDLLRRRRRSGAESDCAAAPGGSSEPLELVIRNEQVRCLQEALSKLPYEQREVVVLHIHAGLTFRAVARALQLSLGTVQSRYRYALDELKTALHSEDQP